MTIYIDQYIIVNTILNFIILRITKSIIKSKSSDPRLFVSSVAGALFAILMLFPQSKPLTNVLGKITFSLVLTGISFKSSGLRTFFKNLAVFYLVSFTLGGCAYSLINILGNTEYTDTAKLLCITVFLSYVILNAITSVYEKHFKNGCLIHDLTICFDNKEIEIKCFYDTGNNLKDPVTKTPVIIINHKAAKQLLPEGFYKEFSKTKDAVALYISFFNILNLKLIPYSTITEKGFIIGFVPTKVLIDGNKTNAIIGISSTSISKDESYNAIVNPHSI